MRRDSIPILLAPFLSGCGATLDLGGDAGAAAPDASDAQGVGDAGPHCPVTVLADYTTVNGTCPSDLMCVMVSGIGPGCCFYSGQGTQTPGTGVSVTLDCPPLQAASGVSDQGQGCGGTEYQPPATCASGLICTPPWYSGGSFAKYGGMCWSPPAVGAGIDILALGQRLPVSLAVDAENVYWLDLGSPPPAPLGGHPYPGPSGYVDGLLMKCPIAGCGGTPRTLASASPQSPGLASTPVRLGVDARSVYWPLGQELAICPVAGCSGPPTALISAMNGGPWSVAVDPTGTYVGNASGGGQVFMCPAGVRCDKPARLWSAPPAAAMAPVDIAVDTTRVYWVTGDGTVLSCDKAAGCGTSGPTTLIAGQAGGPPRAPRIAVDDANVYVNDAYGGGMGRIWECPKSGCNESPTPLATGLFGAVGIATDGVNVYWTETGESSQAGAAAPTGPGTVKKCSVQGCADRPTTIAQSLSRPWAIVLGGSTVFFTELGNSATPSTLDVGRVSSCPK